MEAIGRTTLPTWVMAMGNLPFWLGLGAAQKSAGARGLKRSPHPVISFVIGLVVALVIVAGIFVLFAYQE